MCDFCHQHGEGKVWYLQARNYSRELASSPRVKQRLKHVIRTTVDGAPGFDRKIRAFQRAPRAVRWLVNAYTAADLRRNHHGQVLPIEEVRRLFTEVVTSVTRVPCVCRKGATGRGEAYCMAITTTPGTWDETCRQVLFESLQEGRLDGADLKGVETLSPAEALDLCERFDRQGLVHTVWTFRSPFIGGLCHCEGRTCAALRFLSGGLDVLSPAETRMVVDSDLCAGCAECVGRCPFGALSFDASKGGVSVDPRRCFGCGLCRTVCPEGALLPVLRRPEDPPVFLPGPA